MIEDSVVVSTENQTNKKSYEKQRKQLATAFLLCGIFLVGFVIFAFMSLPKYQANQNVEYLSKAYETIRDIDYYISIQSQGGHLNDDVLKEKIEATTSSLNKVTTNDVTNVKIIWQEFRKLVSDQNFALNTINDAIQIRLRVNASSQSLYHNLMSVSEQLSSAGSVSLETVRYVDQLANSVNGLHANIARMLNSRTQIEIKTIAELTDSLSSVQKGLNVLIIGSPPEAIQSLKGSIEEENIIESQFVFNQLARDVSDLIQDASGIVILNQMKIRLQEEKDKIQNILQITIDKAYQTQQEYITTTNQSVFLISMVASFGTVTFFILFAFLFLRLNKSRLFIASEKDAREQRIDEVMLVLDKFIILRERLLPQLEIVSSLNNEGDNILQKGREVRGAADSFSSLVKSMDSTYKYLEQSFTHDLALLKQENIKINVEELRDTLKKQLKFFIERKEELDNMKHCSILMDEFFANVVSNTNDSVMAYREVEQELMLIISEIDQLNRGLKE